ncbi:MAG: type 2 lanthipeptide synthetase LanM [Acidobacteriota bacterium]
MLLFRPEVNAVLTPRDLLLLEIRGETIDECFALIASSTATEPADETIAHNRAEIWDEALRNDSNGTLLRRIQNEGWDTASLKDAVYRLPSRTVGHGWAADLNWLVHSVQSAGQQDEDSGVSNEPFGHLLAPLCVAAGSRLQQLPHPALFPLQKSILARLCTYAAPALYEEFVRFRQQAGGNEPQAGKSDSIYRSFITAMREGLFLPFLTQRPALARMLINLLTQWMAATSEFMDRLAGDQQAISRLIGSDCSVRDLVTIQSNLSDPHNGGRGVIILTFSSGAQVVYKPRSLAFDSIWNQLTAWLTAQGGPSMEQHPGTLAMGQYGWQAFCDHAPSSPNSASRFYQRLGACLALFRILGSSDMHHENLIANGDQPVFVDLETLVAPSPRIDFSVHPALRAVEQSLLHSVWRSGVLPDAMLLPTGDVMTYGGLAASPSVSGSVWDFLDVNTDRMRFVPIEQLRHRFSNLPYHGRMVFPPSAHVRDIKAGYEKAIVLINRRYADLWSASGPLAGIKSVPIRAIFRPTTIYVSLLNKLRDPRRLRSGISWSAQLELDQGDTQQLGILADHPLLLAERRALVKADIPYFVTFTGQTTVWHNSHLAVPNAIEVAGQGADVVPRPLGSDDIERDCQLIDWSLTPSGVTPTKPWPRFDGGVIGEDQKRLLRTEAERIFEILRRRAVTASDGAAWWGRKSLLKAPSIGVLGPGLYDGLSGIAVFLAAMTRVLQNEMARDLTVRTVATVRSMVQTHRPSRLRSGRTLGIAFGMGGVAYALATIGRLLDDQQSLEIARDAATWVTPEIIQSDQTFDIMDGSAGAIIALLKLFEVTGEERWLTLALLCGSHLQETHQSGRLWWTAPGRMIRTGMAHGLAGIGFALCRLSRKSAEIKFEELGLEALRLIDRSYNESRRDWSSEIQEASTEAEESFWCRWCHGALGIGLAWHEQKSDAIPGLETTSFVKRASQGAVENPTRPADTLCCGNFGNVDYLLEVGQSDEELRSLARSRAAWLISESRRRGHYKFDAAVDEANLGLFPGISGIGYVILRALAPEDVPSLLTFR